MTQPRTVMITGAAGNLGRAVAARFAREPGTRLVLVDRSADALRSAFGADDTGRALLQADLLAADSIEAATRTAVERFGGLDALAHLAGGFRMGEAVHETSTATLEAMLDLNVRTFLHTAHAVVPQLLARGGGRIAVVAAGAALRGAAQMGAYTAAKSAVLRLVESMSAELKDRDIAVNAVLPSIIDTPENRRAMPEADASRWVTPEALADVIAFLLSDAARAVHGVGLPVSGRV